ncbi:MAG: methylmalonyl-CoA epimerase [Pseudobdellovibrionaceae bacterium]|nr:methylmalonyl-CoA epimerase [Bdellovibrionales bacterium]USN48844.1 MAG: methylmalonyl-CoA epimerase [Pseudobdellovibrionaceae bacterium]
MFDLPIQYAFDHVGIAVASLAEGKKFYEALGFKEMHVEEVVTEKVRVGMFELANQARIELLEPMSEDSPVAKFLAKRGPGVHHFCLRVADINEAISKLVASNIRLINDIPRPGAHGCQVAFVHPSAAGGVLVELSQPPKGEGLA